jgi:transcriptional regulator of heat shock response
MARLERWKLERDLLVIDIHLGDNNLLDLLQYMNDTISNTIDERVADEVESQVENEVDEVKTEYEAQIERLEKRVAVFEDFLTQMQCIPFTEPVYIHQIVENDEFKIVVERLGEE